MITIKDFYRVTETDKSMYSQSIIASIEAGLSTGQALFEKQPDELLSFAEYILRFHSDDRRALRQAADRILLKLAESGSAEHESKLGFAIMNREFKLLKSDYPAKDAATWLLKSYKQGYADAAVGLQILYSENRKGSPRDPELSLFYAKEARRLGSTVNFEYDF